MALIIPANIKQIYTKLSNDVKNGIEKANPFKNKSLVKAMLTAFAGRIWDVYKQIEAFIDECFDDTRSGDYLIREAADYGVLIQPAESASGYISVIGVAGIDIDDQTEFSIDSLIYKVQGTTEITEKVLPVTLSYIDDQINVDFGTPHNLGTGQEIVISDSPVSELNGTVIVNVVDDENVSYEIDNIGTGSVSATATFSNAVCYVKSDGTGEIYNKNAGEVLEISESIVDVENQAVVTYFGIVGGSDEEDNESLRSRLQQRKKNPASFFNASQVEAKLRENSIVNRVFIERCYPAIGEATIYILKEDNEIPTTGEIETIKEFFEPFLPITDDYSNIHIEAPTLFENDFNFNSITPDTSTMRQAILNNLTAFFEERSIEGLTIKEDQYRSVITNSVDPESLTRLSDFDLASPTGDLVVTIGQINTLGDITYA